MVVTHQSTPMSMLKPIFFDFKSRLSRSVSFSLLATLAMLLTPQSAVAADDNATDPLFKNMDACAEPPPISELLPETQTVLYATYQSADMAPHLGGGLIGAIADGRILLFDVKQSWGKPHDFKLWHNKVKPGPEFRFVKVFPTLRKLNKDDLYIILGIRDEDYDQYFGRPRVPKEYYDKVIFPFPCGGIRAATNEELKAVDEYFTTQ